MKEWCGAPCVVSVRYRTQGPPLLGLSRNTYTTYLVPDTFKFLSLDDFKRLSPSAKQAYLEELKRYVDAATRAADVAAPADAAAPRPARRKRTPV